KDQASGEEPRAGVGSPGHAGGADAARSEAVSDGGYGTRTGLSDRGGAGTLLGAVEVRGTLAGPAGTAADEYRSQRPVGADELGSGDGGGIARHGGRHSCGG